MKRGKNILIIALLFFTACSNAPKIDFSRELNKTISSTEDSIIVTVKLSNLENSELHGFYYTEFIPGELIINNLSLKINEKEITGFYFDKDTSCIYENCSAYRWILESPPGFSGNNSINFNSFLEIKYSIKNLTQGEFYLNKYNWVGYFPDYKSVFGYSDSTDLTKIYFNEIL